MKNPYIQNETGTTQRVLNDEESSVLVRALIAFRRICTDREREIVDRIIRAGWGS
jgi:hypothetical protein